MGFETIAGTDVQYGLISFDAEGKEISEQGTLMSQRLIDKARTDKVTNVFFFCHGWKGDVSPARIPQTQAERSVCNFVCRA
jgi:hypothetical protein